MVRLAVTFSMVALLGLFACSGGETGGGAGSGADAAPVSAQKGSAPAAPKAPAPSASAEAADPQVQSCLDLVSEGKFVEAVPVCTAALRNHPGNAEVKSALAKAQTQVADAKAAATAAAQGAANEAATDAAGKAVEGATGSMPKLGQ